MRRRTHSKTSRAAACAAIVMMVMAALITARAQQQSSAPAQQGGQKPAAPPAGGQQAAPQQPPAPPAKALLPVAASTLATTPDAYYGEPVSVSAAVEQNISRTAFSIDQDKTKSTGKEVLVLAPNLQRHAEANTYVTVIGEVVKFDPATVASKLKDYKLDIAPDVAAKFTGKPVILATSVIDAAGNDVAKRLPPPMTSDEEAFQKMMKQVGTSNGALRKAIEGSDAKLASEQTAALKKTFSEIEAFWRARRKNDAAQWSQDARKLSENIERAAAAGKWDQVKTHATTLGQACQACHGVYRERFDDGSFRIKKTETN